MGLNSAVVLNPLGKMTCGADPYDPDPPLYSIYPGREIKIKHILEMCVYICMYMNLKSKHIAVR
jgi:hypothetical protein